MIGKIKYIASGLLIGFIISVSVSAFAENKPIEAFFNNIKIVINGKQVVTDTEPFIYEGRTFVPVRFVADNLNMEVKWNETTNTVEMTSKPTFTNQLLTNIKENARKAHDFKTLGDFGVIIDNFQDTLSTTYYSIDLKRYDMLDEAKTRLNDIIHMHNENTEIFKDEEFNQINELYMNTLASYKDSLSELFDYADISLPYNERQSHFDKYLEYQKKAFKYYADGSNIAHTKYLEYYNKTQR